MKTTFNLGLFRYEVTDIENRCEVRVLLGAEKLLIGSLPDAERARLCIVADEESRRKTVVPYGLKKLKRHCKIQSYDAEAFVRLIMQFQNGDRRMILADLGHITDQEFGLCFPADGIPLIIPWVTEPFIKLVKQWSAQMKGKQCKKVE